MGKGEYNKGASENIIKNHIVRGVISFLKEF